MANTEQPILSMKLRLLSVFLVLFWVNKTFAQVMLQEHKKVAITVGVSNYEFAGKLNNTLNDANDISEKLQLLGFEVTNLLDPNLKSMENNINNIFKRLNPSDIFLFYFSGHGAEYNGENYLFLKNSNPTIPNDMPYETYPIGKLIGQIEFAKINTSILILDACRSNPFVKSWAKDGLPREGLVNMNSPNGSFIGFAASPGKTASDGNGKNGTYTEAILKYIELKNTSIDEVFNKVNKDVRIQSNGKQIPFKNSSLEDNFYFNWDSNYNRENAKNEDFEIAPINRPSFKMPKIVTGYRDDRVNSFGLISINKTTFEKSEFIELSMSAFNENMWDKASPMFISIVKKLTANSSTMIYNDQFLPSGKNNSFKISSSFGQGTYELTIGFYLLDEINQEYPPFYNKKYTITIL